MSGFGFTAAGTQQEEKMQDRVPPQNIEAEQSVLGAMLIDKNAVSTVTETLLPEDFYREAHRVIYSAMLTLHTKNEPVDMITVVDELKKQEKAETRKAKKQEKREQAETGKAKKTEKQEAEDAESDQQDGLSDQMIQDADPDREDRDANREFAEDHSEFQKSPETIFTRIGKKFDRFVIAVKDKIEAVVRKLHHMKDKAEQYKKFVRAGTTKQAFQVLKRNVILLLKHLNPTKIKGQVTYGSGDPASTGKQLGYLSLILPLYYNKIDITPDFSKKILEGDIFIKGRIRVYNILYYCCKVYFNKYVKRSMAYLKKISGGNK